MKNRWIVAAYAAVCWTASAQTTAPYAPAPENLQARTAFQDAKFGIFLHWGLYSMLGSGEWTMTNRDINYREYAKLANAFYPHDFDAAEWVSAIKSSGAGYVCFTTRHHDGFSMWDTAQTDYDIVDATPYKQGIVKALSDECARQDIRLHLYYSLIDWYRDDCPRGRTGLGTGRPGTAISYERYYDFMKRQLTELLTGYGPVGAIWFDGVWDQDRNPDFDWKLRGLYDHIHAIRPACLVGNNHHLVPFEGEDIQIFERDLPGENTAGLSGQEIGRLPLETCQTMNVMWGYKITDLDYKSSKIGFRQYMEEYHPSCTILELDLHAERNDEDNEMLDELFRTHPTVKNGITFNSKVYIVGEYLQSHGKKDFNLIGYDLLERNVTCLKEGSVSFLIAQQPELQGFNGIKALCDHLIFKKEVTCINYMPIDLLTVETIDYYHSK